MYTFFFIQMIELPITPSIPTSGYYVTNKYRFILLVQLKSSQNLRMLSAQSSVVTYCEELIQKIFR